MTLRRMFWLGSLGLILGFTGSVANGQVPQNRARPAPRAPVAARQIPGRPVAVVPVYRPGAMVPGPRYGLPNATPVSPVGYLPGYAPTGFSPGLNNPYWGNSYNPFATLSSPLTFSPGSNNPYWRANIQDAANQANAIYLQQLWLQTYYQSYNSPLYQSNPYVYGPYGSP